MSILKFFQHVVGPLVKAVMCDLTLTNQKAGKDSYDNTVLDGGNKELPKIGAKHSLDLSKRKRLDFKLKVSLTKNRKKILTLKALITTAVDDKFCNIFPNFKKK